MSVTDIDQQNFLSNTIQKIVKEKKDPDLDLNISNPDIIILFKKNQLLTVLQ